MNMTNFVVQLPTAGTFLLNNGFANTHDLRVLLALFRIFLAKDEFESSLEEGNEETALPDAIVSCVKKIWPGSSEEDVAQILEKNFKFRAPSSVAFLLQSTLEEVVTKEDFSHMVSSMASL